VPEKHTTLQTGPERRHKPSQMSQKLTNHDDDLSSWLRLMARWLQKANNRTDHRLNSTRFPAGHWRPSASNKQARGNRHIGPGVHFFDLETLFGFTHAHTIMQRLVMSSCSHIMPRPTAHHVCSMSTRETAGILPPGQPRGIPNSAGNRTAIRRNRLLRRKSCACYFSYPPAAS